MPARKPPPEPRRSMVPRKAIVILEKLISDAQTLPAERWDSAKRGGWRDTARVALEQAGVSSTLLDSFDQHESTVFSTDTTDEEFRQMENSGLSGRLAVLQAAINALGWENEEEQTGLGPQSEQAVEKEESRGARRGPVRSSASTLTFDVRANFLQVNGEVWQDTKVVDDYAGFRRGEFFGESVPRVSKLSLQDLAGYFNEIEIWIPGAKKDFDDWAFAYVDAELHDLLLATDVEVAFRIEYDLEFWAKPYSIADLAGSVEKVLGDHAALFAYWQRDPNTCIEGFGVSMKMPWDMSIGDALAKEAELKELASLVRAKLSQADNKAVNLVFDFPTPIKSACEQYLLYFVQFLGDLGIEANAEIKEQASRVLFSVTPLDEKQALEKIYEALQAYLGLPLAPDFAVAASQVRDIAVSQLTSNVLHLQSQLMLAKAAMEMKNATLDAKDAHISLLQDRIDLREFQPKVEPKEANADREELVKDVLAVKKFDFKFIEVNIPEILRKLKRKLE